MKVAHLPGQLDSVWTRTAELPERHTLDVSLTADVCIVGAGIAGLTTAYLLSKEGQNVIVVDDGPVAGGQTCMTTAHLSNVIDDRFTEIERLHGREGSRLAAESHMAAVNAIEIICRDEQIDCDFERIDGYLFDPPGTRKSILQDELKAAARTGAMPVDLISRAPLPSFDTGPCLRFQRQGQFHPLKYMAGLTAAIERAGGRIFTRTHVAEVAGGTAAHVTTDSGAKVSAAAVVVATNAPINDLFAIHTKQAPYHTYAVGLRIPAGSIPHALYWDTADPYHYVRLQKLDDTYDVLIVGGEDHKAGQADDMPERFDRLETWARERFPNAAQREFHWSGQVMEPVDGLAYIGHNPMDQQNVYIATGDSGMGMTHGTIAGILLSDLIRNQRNPWEQLYDPSRKTPRAWGEFIKENLNVASQYTSWLTGGDVASVAEIRPGEGAVIRRGMSKLAVYRDDDGQLFEMSAVCPHLGCILAWNTADKTWDCPCHGSRFAAMGEVVNGPANSDLHRS